MGLPTEPTLKKDKVHKQNKEALGTLLKCHVISFLSLFFLSFVFSLPRVHVSKLLTHVLTLQNENTHTHTHTHAHTRCRLNLKLYLSLPASLLEKLAKTGPAYFKTISHVFQSSEADKLRYSFELSRPRLR